MNKLVTPASAASSVLSENISAVATSLRVANADNFTSSGLASIGNIGSREIVTYSGKSGNTLTGLTRGTNGTVARSFIVGVAVAQLQWMPVIDESDTLATTTDVAGRNSTIQYREDGVDVSTKGGIEYVNFTGAGVTASNPSAGLLQVDVPAPTISDGDKGDITVSASGATWTIDNDVVTFAKMQDVATAKLLGRATGGTGNIEEITLGTNLSYTGTTLNAAGGGISDGDKGDITVSGSGATWTIDNNVVSNTQMATMGISTVKANITGSVTNPQDVDIETGFKPTLALVKADVGLGSVVNADTTTTANITDSANKRFVTDAQQTVIGNTSGTNTGDQTSIVGISGTKAQFDTAVSDGNILYVGDAPTAHATSHKLGGSDVILLNEFGNPTGSVEFNQQQALQFRLENRTSDPGSPAVGQMWLRTDL